MRRRGPRGRGLPVGLALAAAFTLFPRSTAAQTITGTLLDLETEHPIPLGLVMMFTESGDSVTSTITDETGFFELSSETPGGFLLLASALGYRETPAGVFELGEDAAMTVEYRLAPQPLRLDQIVVSLSRPALQHYLIRNGFVRRLQRGLGHFVTPKDIEASHAIRTEDLLTRVPGVRVGTVRVARQGMVIPRDDIGETVQIRSPGGGWCTPAIYVDGMPSSYAPTQGLTVSSLAPLATVQGIEIYRGPAEVPVEYSATQSRGGSDPGACGVLVFWTMER